MFKIVPNPTAEADVRITRYGEADPGVIKFTFKHLGQRECKAWVGRAAEDGSNDATWLAEVISDWAGIVDDQGHDIPFSVEALTKLLNTFPTAGGEIYRAYLRTRLESRAKN